MLSTWRQCGTSCGCAGADAVESVNQSSPPDGEAEAAADLRVLPGCCYNERTPTSLQEGPDIQQPDYSATRPLPTEHSLTREHPFFLTDSTVNQPIRAWSFAHHGLINQSSPPKHCSSNPSGASCEGNTMSKKRPALLGKYNPPTPTLTSTHGSLALHPALHSSHNTAAILDL